VLIQRNGNVSIDVTDLVHPSVAHAVALAARIVGLDIAGVDLVAEDISQPLEGQRGAIVEVNAGPGLLMHLKPAAGTPRPVGKAIVDYLFPENDTGSIPLVGVTGSAGKTTVARLVARMLQLNGHYTGLACSAGLFFDRRHVQRSDAANWEAGRRVLLNRAVHAGVIENGARCILSEGLAYERCRVGVVTNLDPADLYPDFYVDEPEQLAKVFRTQVDVVLPDGVAVLNADDPLVADMASLCDGEVIFFGASVHADPIAQHCANGGRAVYMRDDKIIFAAQGDEVVVTELPLVPLLEGGRATWQRPNILAAVAAAWALDIPMDIIRAGIETFEADAGDAPVPEPAQVSELAFANGQSMLDINASL
jgi:cyanophycin synthetase